MDKSVEKRIANLERKIERLTKVYKTFYNNQYAVLVRRKEGNKKHRKWVKRWAEILEKMEPKLRQIGRVIGQVKKGKTIMTLSRREYRLLYHKLRGYTAWESKKVNLRTEN